MVKKIIRKKLTDIHKASRCALAELSRLVRKADFNNSWGGKKWCKKQIWILTNLTRDMSRWGLYADCMICDQLTPDGDCSENNLKKWMETKKRRKLLTTTWRPSKKFSPMMTMVCPPDVQPSDGERALTWGKKMKTWKKCKIKKTIYVSCEKVVRGNAMHRQSPSHFLREVGNLPRNCTV